ncbi:hypothetical protein H4R18_000715 [Coemansia javaensis]|uniref:Arrestin-like N-terminal domain-containing protein n=1 Tax=Coemansia javaensis TaxID=2761396 RepID=A0A9W8LLB3_9FUNG|nr:hypothetical protein H4R18_000715 [Coemansia javaensis]
MCTPVFEIRFPAYTSGRTPRCSPKSTLAGVVYLQLGEAQRAACLSLSLVGSERIRLAPESVNGAWAAAQGLGTAKQRTVKKVYFNQLAVLWGDSKLRMVDVLAPGVHMFHFSCEFPRANYPQSRTTAEYEIRYVLKARLLDAQGAAATAAALLTATQEIEYVPETVAPVPRAVVGARGPATVERFVFCDDAAGDGAAFHVRAAGLQQAFRPGGSVDLQLRISGQRTVRRMQFSVIEQTDCFYPQIPEPREEQLDIGRRLWSSQRVVCAPTALPFERDSCAASADCCAAASAGAGGRRSGRGAAAVGSTTTAAAVTYHAQLRAHVPDDAAVVHETGYLRYTLFAQISLGCGGGRWARVNVPLPVATRVLPEDAAPPLPPSLLMQQQQQPARTSGAQTTTTPPPPPAHADGQQQQRRMSSGALSARSSSRRRGPSTSSSIKTEVGSLDLDGDMPPVPVPPPPPLKHGRSIADLGARLQQLVPRRGAPFVGRAVSHGRLGGGGSDAPPQWALADLPPVPSPPSLYGASLYGSPLARPASLAAAAASDSDDGATLQAAPISAGSNNNNNSAAAAASGCGERFSLRFLERRRELLHAEAEAAALGSLIAGCDAEPASGVIPCAIIARNSGGGGPALANPAARQRGEYRARDSSLGLGDLAAARRHKRASVQSLASAVAVCCSDRVRPRIEAVMASFRNPVTSHVATWSALGRPAPALQPQQPQQSQRDAARYSRLSAMSVSSNDTACAAGSCLELPKDLLHPLPAPLSPLLDAAPAILGS